MLPNIEHQSQTTGAPHWALAAPAQNPLAISQLPPDLIYQIIRSSGLSDFDIAHCREACHVWKKISDISNFSALATELLNPSPISQAYPKLKIYGEKSWLKHLELELNKKTAFPVNIIQHIKDLQKFSKKESEDESWLLILIPPVTMWWMLKMEKSENYKMPKLSYNEDARLNSDYVDEPYWVLMKVGEEKNTHSQIDNYLFRKTEWQIKKTTVLEAIIAYLLNQSELKKNSVTIEELSGLDDPFDFIGMIKSDPADEEVNINVNKNKSDPKDSHFKEDDGFSRFSNSLSFRREIVSANTSFCLTSRDTRAIKRALHSIKNFKLDLSCLAKEQLKELFQQAIERDLSTKINKISYFIEYEKKTPSFKVSSFDEEIGWGNHLKVLRVKNCFENTFESLKTQYHIEDRKSANRQLQYEFDFLATIHSNGVCWGIQLPYRKLIQIQESFRPVAYGLLGKLYDMDYQTYLTLYPQKNSFEDYLFEFHQLLSALNTLHKKNILHGDIKEKNILITIENDRIKLCHLADYGTAVIAKKNTPTKSLTATARKYTPGDSLQKDIELAETLLKQPDQLITLEKKRDVFLLGNVFHFALQQGNSKELIDDYNPNTSSGLNPNMRVVIPVEMHKLIKDMLSPDYQNRPDASQAFERYNNLLKDQYPQAYAQIWDTIKADYPGTLFYLD